jgi:CheY-like chemotaxis protein
MHSHIVLLSSDLMLAAAAEGICERRGATLSTAQSLEDALERCEEADSELVILDLRLPGLNVAEAVLRIREELSPAPHVMACGPHVHAKLLAAATAAGCDAVITRGQFELGVESVLDQFSTGG